VRFLADGPAIPDELLVARDEGRVIFFCGAGVSRANAGLRDFLGLAEEVINTLETSGDTPTKRLLRAARRVEKEERVSGLVPADRIFGLLERSFTIRDIQKAVAQALQPPEPADLTAHRIMLDLAGNSDGKLRLVTTNFDLLFEACDPSLKSSFPPHLPEPRRAQDLSGVIHLHGRVDSGYSGAEGDGFILSSSEFGRAYISDGWATKFIATLIEQYFVVFVGYGADDPPVQYLLEALNRDSGSRGNLYAFQSGTAVEAGFRWEHKGVVPIAYAAVNGDHSSLWETLAAWARRAKNPKAWYTQTIAMAAEGPGNLLPYERGQVMHIVGTLDGARQFAAATTIPPAEWLCVFDPAVRYSRPERLGSGSNDESRVDPFDLYGLDSDPPPSSISADDYRAKRVVPPDASNAISLTRLDRQDRGPNGLPSFSGHWATHIPLLPDRLQQIGHWLSAVAHQPATLWWAAGQQGLHPDICTSIQYRIERSDDSSSPMIRKAWRILFDSWKARIDDFYAPWFRVRASIQRDGWYPGAARQFALTRRPYMSVKRPFYGSPRPPDDSADLALGDLMVLDVEYAQFDIDIPIPDSEVLDLTREARKNLEHAIALEAEAGGYSLGSFPSIEPEEKLEGIVDQRNFGFASCILFFAGLFKRLVNVNAQAAKQEYGSWRTDDETAFARLRIWGGQFESVLNGSEFRQFIGELSESVFWSSYHQRDLLLTLAKRWPALSGPVGRSIEQRLLRGPQTVYGQNEAEVTRSRAWVSLSIIEWLHNKGCQFQFDFESECSKLRVLSPDWKPEFAANVARSLEGRAGYVGTDTEFNELISVPLASLLPKAVEIGATRRSDFVASDPFAGLVAARPVRALVALGFEAKHGEYPVWAWTTYLTSPSRTKDRPRLMGAIAQRIFRLSTLAAGQLAGPITSWLQVAASVLCHTSPGLFKSLLLKLIAALRENPQFVKSALVRSGNDIDWVTEAINSPTGKLMEALMLDSRWTRLTENQGLPEFWTSPVEQVLSLAAAPARHYALAVASRNLIFLYFVDPAWTQRHLLDGIVTDQSIREALWAGFVWGNHLPGKPLYDLLKPQMVEQVVANKGTRHEPTGFLAAMLLSGWNRLNAPNAPKSISDAEMRDLLFRGGDEFRAQILWLLQRWTALGQPGSEEWLELLPALLKFAWPRHKAAKSRETSAQLCTLAFSSARLFVRIADIIVDLVEKTSAQRLTLPTRNEDTQSIPSQFPMQTLAVLFAILPEDVHRWPYGIEMVLQRITDADPSLLRDARLIELSRLWSSR
jgi:hypothetical protein